MWQEIHSICFKALRTRVTYFGVHNLIAECKQNRLLTINSPQGIFNHSMSIHYWAPEKMTSCRIDEGGFSHTSVGIKCSCKGCCVDYIRLCADILQEPHISISFYLHFSSCLLFSQQMNATSVGSCYVCCHQRCFWSKRRKKRHLKEDFPAQIRGVKWKSSYSWVSVMNEKHIIICIYFLFSYWTCTVNKRVHTSSLLEVGTATENTKI